MKNSTIDNPDDDMYTGVCVFGQPGDDCDMQAIGWCAADDSTCESVEGGLTGLGQCSTPAVP